MKYIAALIAAAGLAVASKGFKDYLPECSLECLAAGLADATPCKPDDLECFCIADHYRATYTASVACVLQSCGNDVSVGEVLPAAAGLCEVVVAAQAAGSSAASSVVSAAETATAAISQATSAAASAATDAAATATLTTITSAPAESSTSTAAAAAAAAASTSSAGAGHIAAGLGLVVPVALAAVVYL
ncbi:hypothetical protein B0T17DRAFT_510738 [Bombardia bombarda]|uniref:CFEM domain-containing protein n=1 Tax=Bombardia bombarda TaxID=252184 RepID=A0AA40BVB3_9PEZI|nr:hypothetical protein B0T17DRAFT_510738 [Bombardia bombarda]